MAIRHGRFGHKFIAVKRSHGGVMDRTTSKPIKCNCIVPFKVRLSATLRVLHVPFACKA